MEGTKQAPRASGVWHEVKADDAAKYPDGVNQIYQGNIDGLLIKQVFSKDEMQTVRDGLEGKRQFMMPLDYGHTLGAALVKDGERESFKVVAKFQEHLKQLFGEEAFESRIEKVFNSMAGERQVRLFSEGEGKTYSPATFRLIQPGKCLLIHRGNEYIQHSAFSDLSEKVNLHNHLSYFLIIDPPQEGGELYIYNFPNDKLTATQDELDFDTCDVRIVKPEAGDMVMFHGGCIYHKINEVSGPKERISLGGFMGVAKDDQSIYYWS